MKLQNRLRRAMALLAALTVALALPAHAEECENGRHVFAASAPSDENGHAGACALCGLDMTGAHESGWVDNGDGTHSPGCPVCGYVAEGAEATAHAPDHSERVEPTCTQDGSETSLCACGFVLESRTLPAAGHDVDDGVRTREPTCTEDGAMTYTCRTCGESRTQPIPATGHDYGKGEITTPATAAADGVRTFTCAHCGDTVTQVIPATGETAADGEAPANGQNADAPAKGDVPAENPTDGDAPANEKPSNGQNGDAPATGKPSSDDDAPTTDAPSEEPAPTQPAGQCSHSFGEWSFTDARHERTCALCGWTESGEHSFGEWMTSGARHGRACEICGYTAAAAHRFGEGTVTLEPTADADGEIAYTCADCGFVRREALPASGHHWSEAWEEKAGDDENHYRHCTDEGCGRFYGAPHRYAEQITPATCAEEGRIVYTCADCGHQMTAALEKTAHTWGGWTSDDSAHSRQCSVCGAKETAAHDWSAACYDAQSDPEHHLRSCVVCGRATVDSHVWDEGRTATEPTPYATGLREFRCTVENCTAAKYETLQKTEPTLSERYLTVPVRVTCNSREDHETKNVELALATADFGRITLRADGLYGVERTIALGDSWQEYFLDLAGWSGSHRLTVPSSGKVTVSATLSTENVWEADTVKLAFEDTDEKFTVRFKSGDRVVETLTVDGGAKIGALPEIDDAEFLGWYYKNGEKVSPDDRVNANLTVYARYSYDVPKTGNNDHQWMLVLLGVSGAMVVVMAVAAVQLIRLNRRGGRRR